MLDRTAETSTVVVEAERHEEASVRRPQDTGIREFAYRAWQFFVNQSFSSLTRRIVFLNVAGLLALVIGILYLSGFRAGLIDARVQSLLVQGEIIAAAIAASATVETNTITVDPERLLERAFRRSGVGARIPDQSRERGAGFAPTGLADQDAGTDL